MLAADVVYDRNITEHFFKTLHKILRTPKVIARKSFDLLNLLTLQVVFLAIERRQSDPRDSEQVFASNFAFFKHKLDSLRGCVIENFEVSVNQESIGFEQYFHYSRVGELTLWRIESKCR